MKGRHHQSAKEHLEARRTLPGMAARESCKTFLSLSFRDKADRRRTWYFYDDYQTNGLIRLIQSDLPFSQPFFFGRILCYTPQPQLAQKLLEMRLNRVEFSLAPDRKI